MNALVLLLTLTTSTLVLRSGDRIAVDGAVREENGVVTFRTGGLLYSLPAVEIDVEATQTVAAAQRVPKSDGVWRLRVSEEERQRLLAELEKNHEGSPPARVRALDNPPPTVYTPEEKEQTSEEWAWRNRARDYEERIRQSREDLQLLEERVQQLRAKISGLISLGFKPNAFTYDTSLLARTIEQIPYAELEVTRAERAFEQFREDARRQGVLPGWLR